MEGFLLIDKPSGHTSHDIVDAVRHLTHLQQVGHAGTLDPFATGLLIIGVGRATKEMSKLVGLDKEYIATLKLGATSDTYDRTGAIVAGDAEAGTVTGFSEEKIKEVLKKFTGQIQQIPPMFSAKKVKGKKLYELARAGIEIERKPVSLIIYSINIISESPSTSQSTSTGSVGILSPERSGSGVEGLPLLKIKVRCSSGTYIRTLAHDIGQALGCGAYLQELRRTMIGPFRVEDASPLSTLNKENIATKMRPIAEILNAL